MQAPILAYTIPQAMQALNCGRNTLYDEINSGRLKSFTVGRRRYISENALRQYIADREAETQSGEAAA